jgi:hypothetical protein
VPGPWCWHPGLSATHIMSSLYAHAFSHQAAFRRLSFQHNLKRATYPSQRAPLPSPLRSWHLRHHVTPSRVMATAGTGLAGAGLGLSLYANFQKLNCERRESHLILVPNLVEYRKSWGHHHLFTTPIDCRIGNPRPSASPSSPRIRCQHV